MPKLADAIKSVFEQDPNGKTAQQVAVKLRQMRQGSLTMHSIQKTLAELETSGELASVKPGAGLARVYSPQLRTRADAARAARRGETPFETFE